ncbi:MAG: PKD domain-containing protein, partial [Planctomycetota bacterium]
NYINVTSPPPPVANFTANPTSGSMPLVVQFTSTSTGSITSYSWDFNNDGTADSSDSNPSYTYNEPGVYSIKLTVSGPGGSNSSTQTDLIEVLGGLIYVDLNATGAEDGSTWDDAFTYIQDGLDAAEDGETVCVANGTYTGFGNTNLIFGGIAIHLKSDGGAESCIIDGEGLDRCFTFEDGETAEAIVEGFTIRNGYSYDYGGCIYCEYDSNPTIKDCIITGGLGEMGGGGIACEMASPTIINCTITENTNSMSGAGGINLSSSNAVITNCIISNNTMDSWSWMGAGGIGFEYGSSAIITNCLICDNTGSMGGAGGANFTESSPVFINCTIAGNFSDMDGGGVFIDMDSVPEFYNTIIWGNMSFFSGPDIYTDNEDNSAVFEFCDFDESTVEGWGVDILEPVNCINADPEYNDSGSGDYSIASTSPCVDAGDDSQVPAGVTTDLAGNARISSSAVDIGAYESQ